MNSAEKVVSWRVAHASVRGAGHLRSGLPCQDAAASAKLSNVTAVVVCDGAGSASLSHYGARAVSEGMCELLTQSGRDLSCLKPEEVVDHSLCCIEDVRAEKGGARADFACTLVGLAVIGNTAHIVHIGDGAVVGVSCGEPTLLSEPDNGEFTNTTTFVTSRDAVTKTRIQHRPIGPLFTSFALLSDGSAEAGLMHGRKGRVSQVVEQVASWLDSDSEASVSDGLERFISSHLVSRTSDDCALAILRREGGPASSFVCSVCGRWSLVRASGGGTHFRIKCPTCKRVIWTARGTGRGYPSVAREWVADLANCRGMSKRATARATGIHRRTVQRWLKSGQGGLQTD